VDLWITINSADAIEDDPVDKVVDNLLTFSRIIHNPLYHLA
jgi:hypothetical protein